MLSIFPSLARQDLSLARITPVLNHRHFLSDYSASVLMALFVGGCAIGAAIAGYLGNFLFDTLLKLRSW